jgi:hypothetical protein
MPIWYKYLCPFWYTFYHFGSLLQEKSGNPVLEYIKMLKINWLSLFSGVTSERIPDGELPHSAGPGTDVIIFQIFSPKKSAKKLAFLTQNTAEFNKK